MQQQQCGRLRRGAGCQGWGCTAQAPSGPLPPLCLLLQREAERQKIAQVPGMLNPYEQQDDGDMNGSD